jgi:hypothetical protein
MVRDAQDVADALSVVGGRHKLWQFVIPVMTVLVLASLLIPKARHQWVLSFERQPTPYTALSISDASPLPTRVAAGALVRLSFSITNHEGKAARYGYVVTSSSAGRDSVVLQRSEVSVGSGQTRSVLVGVRPRCSSTQCQIAVRLTGYPEFLSMNVATEK